MLSFYALVWNKVANGTPKITRGGLVKWSLFFTLASYENFKAIVNHYPATYEAENLQLNFYVLVSNYTPYIILISGDKSNDFILHTVLQNNYGEVIRNTYIYKISLALYTYALLN